MATATIAPPSATTGVGFGRRNAPLLVSTGVALVMVILYTWLARWRGVALSIDIPHVMDTLAPLLLASAFIERAVEVIISPWRDAEANQLESALNELKARTPAADPSSIEMANAAFHTYTGRTQQYAFAASMTLSLSAAYVGVRALWPFVNQANFNTLDKSQQWMFLVVDVVLSAAMLAGGADGIHQVVNAFTTFFSTTAQKTQQSLTIPPKQ
jgi:hypothetical protein